MIKVVVLDDEYLVIEALQTLINWKKFNMEIVGTAMDGQSGFDLIIEKRPQIVLTDIRMPAMDGLSIIEKVKYIYPKMQFILFSGYTDFEYAKRAIVLGVLDYIVKPITSDKVEGALIKALSKIDEEGNGNVRQEIQKSLLTGGKVSKEIWKKTEAPIEINDIKECLIIICSIPEQNNRIRAFLDKAQEMKKYGVFYSAYPAMQMIMCLGTGTNSKEKMLESLKGAVRIWKQDEEEGYIGLSYAQIVQTGIPKVFERAKEAMSYAAFIGEQQVVDYQTIQMSRRLPQNIVKYEKMLMEYMNSNMVEKIKELIAVFIAECKELHTEPNMVKHFILEFIYSAISLKRKATEGGKSRSELGWNNEYECPPHIHVNKCTNYQELSVYFQEEILRITDGIAEMEGESKNRSQIQSVVDYIHTRYQKDLTLFELAEIAKMTPAYFSHIFKAEMGISYIKYLTKVRIEKAKSLLEQGYKVFEVSEQVGYDNYRYFCVIFKKYTGVTAQQFKCK